MKHLVSPREQEVLTLLAQGKKTGAIARLLYVSPKTIEKHVCNLRVKLGLASSSELVVYACQQAFFAPWIGEEGR